MRTLKDRVAVVTGAAGGIGRATAVALAEAGSNVALVDIDELGLAETRRKVEAAGRRASVHRVDVANRDAMEALVAEVLDAHGQVNVVVNNAGVSVTKRFDEQSLDDFEWLIGINFWGVVYGAKFFLPEIKKGDEGYIVNISSMFGFIGLPSQTSYAASKFAVHGMSESMRYELAPHGIGVMSVHPGMIRTGIVKAARIAVPEAPGLQDGVARTFDRFGWPPERVANKIVHGIRRGHARVVVGPEAYLVDWIKRASPVLPRNLVHRAWTATLRRR